MSLPIPHVIGGTLALFITSELNHYYQINTLTKFNSYNNHIEKLQLASSLVKPLAYAAIGSLASRVGAGGLGLIAKGSSMLANKYGYDDLSETLEGIESKLNTFATREIKTDILLAAGLSVLTTCAVALNIFMQPMPQL